MKKTIALAFAVPSAIAAVVAACTNLPDLTAGYCGNSVIDPGEQCDSVSLIVEDASYTCFAADAGAPACHLECNEGGACPSGWGCGADQVCREPSGSFPTMSASIAADIRQISLADFDGDHRLDVLTHGAATTTVTYFDGTGAVTGTSSLILPRGQVVAGDLTGSGSADLLSLDSLLPSALGDAAPAVLGTGVDLWRGQGRTLANTLFPSVTLPKNLTDCRVMAATTGLNGTLQGGQDMLIFASNPGTDLLAAVNPQTGLTTPMWFWTAEGGSLVVDGDVAVGRLDKAKPCDSVAVGFHDDTVLYSFATCIAVDGGVVPNTVMVPPVAVDGGNPIAGPVLLVDANRDGNLDMLTTVKIGGEFEVETSLGDGAGGFAAATVSHVYMPGTTTPALYSPVLSAGFIDGDGKLDFVDQRGVVLSSLAGVNPSASDAVIGKMADLNNDGKLDVVVASANGVDVWLGTGTVALDHTFYAVPAASWLAVGDIDGDFVDDVVVTTGNNLANVGSSGSLSVLYGQNGGYPQAPVLVGDIPNTFHVAAGRFAWVFGEPAPNAIDSPIVTGQSSTGALSIFPIEGQGDRQLTSPFLLSGEDASSNGTQAVHNFPVTGAIGNVPHGGTGDLDASLVVLTTSSPEAGPLNLQLWTAPATTDTNILTASTLIAPAPDAAQLTAGVVSARNAAMIAIDWDLTRPGDEVMALLPSHTRLGTLSLLASDTNGVWSQINGDDAFDGSTRIVDSAEVGLSLAKGDFNGDGRQDLLVVYSDEEDASSTQIFAKVILSDGTAASASWGAGVSLPIMGAGAIAPVHVLGNTAATQLVVARMNQLMFYSFDANMGLVEAGVPPQPIPFANPVALAAGDINGDGVDDIVVGEPKQFAVLWGKAVVP